MPQKKTLIHRALKAQGTMTKEGRMDSGRDVMVVLQGLPRAPGQLSGKLCVLRGNSRALFESVAD